MITAQRLEILKTRLLDDLKRGTASELKKCIYVIGEDIIDEFNQENKVKSFDLAVDRKKLLENNWWLGSVDSPVFPDKVDDLMIAKFTLIDRPYPSDYKLEGYHVDAKSADEPFTKHAVLLASVDTFVPILGKFISEKAASFIKDQVSAVKHIEYVVCSTKALLFKSASDVVKDTGMFSINMGIRFPWKVDYQKTNEYTGLCFYKI